MAIYLSLPGVWGNCGGEKTIISLKMLWRAEIRAFGAEPAKIQNSAISD
ncbi:hypothetical protein [Agrobacterium sp. V1]|nr:hypothetical protein [Agrobacterium sp. V1]MDO3444641.1 hypothetical protein [Agrobacterium sp. V1]